MLTISPQCWAALEVAHGRKSPLRFHSWWSTYSTMLGSRDAFSLGTMLEQYRAEFAVTGLREELQLFLFCVARTRMPEMGDRQYLAVMDVLVGRQSDRDKIVAIDEIARTVPSDD